MRASGNCVRKAKTPEDVHVVVRRVFTEETKVRGVGGDGSGRPAVEDVGCGVKGLNPESGR